MGTHVWKHGIWFSERLISKRFYFCPLLHDWTLPEPTEMFVAIGYKDGRLQMLKDELKSVLRILGICNLDDWYTHTCTRATNTADDIQHKLHQELDPELLTEDWCRFYENAMSFNLICHAIVLTECLNLVHLCETSGSFITALNHYMMVQNSGTESLLWQKPFVVQNQRWPFQPADSGSLEFQSRQHGKSHGHKQHVAHSEGGSRNGRRAPGHSKWKH
jgi:hypothetical protein